MFEKRKLRRLKEYYEKIVHPKSPFPAGYIDDKRAQISTLEWLIAYYEGRAANKLGLYDAADYLRPKNE